MPVATPTLIAVIGPVDPALFAAWVSHYRVLGVTRFQVGFRFPSHTSAERRQELRAACRSLGLRPTAICCGDWSEHTDTELRNVLREKAGTGWHLLAGAQEFHQFPLPLGDVIDDAERAGAPVVGGVLLDRVTADGHLPKLRTQGQLDATFPLGGHLTYRLLGGDPRRVVLARSEVSVAPGNQRTAGQEAYQGAVAAVHHFAWHTDAMDVLRRSAVSGVTGAGPEPSGEEETRFLLGLVERLAGRIDVADVRLRFRHVSLAEMPYGWHDEAGRVMAGLRAPAAYGAGR